MIWTTVMAKNKLPARWDDSTPFSVFIPALTSYCNRISFSPMVIFPALRR